MVGQTDRSDGSGTAGRPPQAGCFHLVLMVTHACNLRCDYCYTGAKHRRFMSAEIGRRCIDRAIRSLEPGGTLELGFFGGEPLLAAELVANLLAHARHKTESAGIGLRTGITTNGTVRTTPAWQLMLDETVDLCVSCDGPAAVHNRHRRSANRKGTANRVLDTIEQIQKAGRNVRVMMVVRPDNCRELPERIAWSRTRHIRQVDLALDVWARWTSADMAGLEEALVRTGELWLAGLPDHGINWFDEKAARLTGVPTSRTARCGFGDGEVAVAPSGRLYPCERLIGEDAPDHPMRLAGHALEGDNFRRHHAPGRSATACDACAVADQCNTTCRCNNYVRTGDPRRPDALLCLLDKVCLRETARALTESNVSLSVVEETREEQCRLSLRERALFRGAKGNPFSYSSGGDHGTR